MKRTNNLLNGIHGIMMTPVAMNDKAFKRILNSSPHKVKKDFLKEYNDRIGQMTVISMCAKVFIRDNWKKVKSWRGLDVVITSRSGQADFYNFVERKRRRVVGQEKPFDKIISRIDRDNKKRHNPITSVKKLFLDHDWDLNMLINGKTYAGIDEEGAVIIASFVEEKIKEQKLAAKLLKKGGSIVMGHK